MNNHHQRIIEIFGGNCKINDDNFVKYYQYLKSKTTFPCVLTGVEDFLWEEKYVLGGWDKKEYEELKKDNPSYTDEFELIEFLEPVSGDDDLIVNVRRLSDKKKFEIGLSWLKCTNKSCANYKLLYDFLVWQVNY